MKRTIILFVLISQIMSIAFAQDTAVFARNNEQFIRTDSVFKIIYTADYNPYLKGYPDIEKAMVSSQDSMSTAIYRNIMYGGILYRDSLHITNIYANKIGDIYYLDSQEYNTIQEEWSYDKEIIAYYIILLVVMSLSYLFFISSVRFGRSLINLLLFVIIILLLRGVVSYFGVFGPFYALVFVFLGLITAYIINMIIATYFYLLGMESEAKKYKFMVIWVIINFYLNLLLFIANHDFYMIGGGILLLMLVIALIRLHQKLKTYKNSNEFKIRNSKETVYSFRQYMSKWNERHNFFLQD